MAGSLFLIRRGLAPILGLTLMTTGTAALAVPPPTRSREGDAGATAFALQGSARHHVLGGEPADSRTTAFQALAAATRQAG